MRARIVSVVVGMLMSAGCTQQYDPIDPLEMAGGPMDDCAAVVEFGGQPYALVQGLVRQPIPGGSLGTGTIPYCGATPAGFVPETFDVFTIDGVDPEVAVTSDVGVLVPGNVPTLPQELASLNDPVHCAADEEMIVWVAPVRFSEDAHQVPDEVYGTAVSGRAVAGKYRSVEVAVQITADTIGTELIDGPERVEPVAVTVKVHCDGARFVADRIDTAEV